MSKLSVAQVNARIESHEAVCAERWLEIIHRVKRVEHFFFGHLDYPGSGDGWNYF